MAEREASRTGWEHTVLVRLFGPRRNPPRERRFFSLVTLVSLVSPGSVPFAVAATAIEATFARDHYTGGVQLAWLLAALRVGMPVVLAGYRPLAAWVVVALTTPVGAVLVRPSADLHQPWPFIPTALFAYWIVQYAVTRAHRWYTSLTTLAVMTAVVIWVAVRYPAYTTRWPVVALFVVFSFVWWLVGDVVRVRLASGQRLAEEERLTAEERARRQLLEDRARIARELHDVVAHHMSVIAVQSSTAAYRIDGLTDAARKEFEEIGDAARASLAEMRRLLAVLRNDDDETLRTPQPGLAGIEALVETTRRAGTPVSLDVRRAPGELPDTIALTAYRVAQEALSNVVRHASGATTTVDVFERDRELVVRVMNFAPPDGGPRVEQPGPGHGLLGMRERVTVVGGRLTAEPRADGGFLVEAVLPLTVAKGAAS
ncbi:MAG: sensor histidine kinase [Streptosporangiales bacterium]|nr:sensor histidine kinase [Streptosporangiales bacterium]